MKNKRTEMSDANDCLTLADSIALRFLNIPGYGPKEIKAEALIYLHDAWDEFDPAGKHQADFPAWAAWKIHRRFLDLYRKQMRLAGKTESLNAAGEDGDEPVNRIQDTRAGADVRDAARHAESIRIFHEALEKLTPDERAVLLAVMDEKSYSEIGREHGGISKEAVRKRFWKAAAHLREVLGAGGYVDITDSGVLTSKRRWPASGLG